MSSEDIRDMREELQRLENEKRTYIEKAKKVNRRLRYKNMELKAISPFVKNTKDIRTGPIKGKLRRLEFKISTQAFTPKKERELLKRIKSLEKDMGRVLKIEKARRKKNLIEKDLVKLNKDKEEVDEKLTGLRTKIKDLRGKVKQQKKIKSVVKGKPIQSEEDKYFSLEDIVQIKKNNKDNKE